MTATKVALVTGGSSGIGRGLVMRLSAAGHRVAFTHLADESGARDVEKNCKGAKGWESDAGNSKDVAALFDAIEAEFGAAPDLVVNNAGVQTWAHLTELEEKDWDRVIGTNLKGTFLVTQQAARRLIAAGRPGSIVNIGSGSNKLALPKLVDYTASKGGIEQLTKVSAAELGPYDIRVNCVAPGAILIERTLDENPDYEEVWGGITPLRRVGRPDDVADVVLFFASDAARFVTGQTLYVDGGLFSQAAWPYPV